MSKRRQPPRLVFDLIFSMPPGTPPKKVLRAVRKLADDEWQMKHRYAMTLHTDDDHPHGHVVLRAMGHDGQRLHIRKATLRAWREQFAENLRELGIAANATERAVRGLSRTRKSDGIYRAAQRGASWHIKQRVSEAVRDAGANGSRADPGADRVRQTRSAVMEGWRISRLLHVAPAITSWRTIFGSSWELCPTAIGTGVVDDAGPCDAESIQQAAICRATGTGAPVTPA
jgi:hypothetical protein